MKKLLFVLFILFTFQSYSQNYQVVGIMAAGIETEYNGTITVTDSLFVLKAKINGVEYEGDYDVKSKRNNITYLTDGEMTHSFIVTPKPEEIKTKKKKKNKSTSFEYTHLIYFNNDDRQSPMDLIYLVNILD